MRPPRIALLGDYRAEVVAHLGIDRSMALAAATTSGLTWEWIHTATIGRNAGQRLGKFTGIWLVPASPYADESAVFSAITHARVNQVPFLGTCGGFQHALLEFAREVLGLREAGHAETQPNAPLQFITPLSCSLVEQKGMVHLVPGTRLREIYGADAAEEGYHCSFGLNPEHEKLLAGRGEAGPCLRIAARDDEGEVRAVELPDHPFYIATLFQPERRALAGSLHPVVQAFLKAAR
jgi:CTP synthase (UTP-ammonia lyase)